MAMMRYMVVVERGETSWGAHVPDLPGCVAVGRRARKCFSSSARLSSFTSTA